MAKSTRTSAAGAHATRTKRSSAAAKKFSGSAAVHDHEATLLRALFLDELRDIYWAEKHLTKALPKMREGATLQELANAFENHLIVTEEQIVRLEQVFSILGEKARAVKCEGIEGLVMEVLSVMEGTPAGTAVRDAGLIISAQKIEHYEIAAYGSLVQLAKTMGLNEAADTLQLTLDEEKEADIVLTELAVSGININADNENEDNRP